MKIGGVKIGIQNNDQAQIVPVSYVPLHLGSTWHVYSVICTVPAPTDDAPDAQEVVSMVTVAHDELEAYQDMLGALPGCQVTLIERQPLEEQGFHIIKTSGKQFSDG